MKRWLAVLLCCSMLAVNPGSISAEELTDGTEFTGELPEAAAEIIPEAELLGDGVQEEVPAAETETLLSPEEVVPETQFSEVEILEEEPAQVGETEEENSGKYPLSLVKENIPDDTLREALRQLDPDGDNSFSYEEAMAVTDLELCGLNYKKRIASLEGLEYFPNLTHLDCSYNHFESAGLMDFSMFPHLQYLNCNYSEVSSLQLTGLTELKELHCAGNQLIRLNLKNNESLRIINCANNQLRTLSVVSLKSLEWLQCNDNQLNSLTVRDLPALQTLSCGLNALTSLNVQGLGSLQSLLVNHNHLSTLDISGLTKLRKLSCSYNILEDLNVARNREIQYLDCSYNRLTKVNVTGLSKLSFLDVRGNYIPYQSAVVGRSQTLSSFYFYEQKQNDDYRTEVTELINTTNGIEIHWKKAPKAERYRLYRKTSAMTWSNWQLLTTVSKNQLKYVDTTVKSGVTYQYTVRAYDTDLVGNRTERSGMALECLQMPKIQAVTNRSNGIYLLWNSVVGAQKYLVYRRNPGGSWKKIKEIYGTKNNSYVDQEVSAKNGTLYEYTVRARGYQDYSAYDTNGKRFCRLQGSVWKSVQALTGRKAQLSWSVNGRASGYRLQYSLSPTFANAVTVQVNGYRSAERTVMNLQQGKTYYVRVRSYRIENGREYCSPWSGTRTFVVKE